MYVSATEVEIFGSEKNTHFDKTAFKDMPLKCIPPTYEIFIVLWITMWLRICVIYKSD